MVLVKSTVMLGAVTHPHAPPIGTAVTFKKSSPALTLAPSPSAADGRPSHPNSGSLPSSLCPRVRRAAPNTCERRNGRLAAARPDDEQPSQVAVEESEAEARGGAKEAPGQGESATSAAADRGEAGPADWRPVDSPVAAVAWGGRQPRPRRFWFGATAAASLVLGSNFLGITSAVLGSNADVARRARLDLLFPVAGFKRCVDYGQGFEFIYPAAWVGDQRLVYRAAERGERERALDPPPLSDYPRREWGIDQRAGVVASSSQAGIGKEARPVEPLVAFGPVGGSGESNVSVITASVPRRFRLENFGSAQDVGSRLLDNVFAPAGSGREAELLAASDRAVSGVNYYMMEYTVRGPEFFRHNLSVCAVFGGRLYTFNAQTPEEEWVALGDDLRAAAGSFRVMPAA